VVGEWKYERVFNNGDIRLTGNLWVVVVVVVYSHRHTVTKKLITRIYY